MAQAPLLVLVLLVAASLSGCLSNLSEERVERGAGAWVWEEGFEGPFDWAHSLASPMEPNGTFPYEVGPSELAARTGANGVTVNLSHAYQGQLASLLTEVAEVPRGAPYEIHLTVMAHPTSLSEQETPRMVLWVANELPREFDNATRSPWFQGPPGSFMALEEVALDPGEGWQAVDLEARAQSDTGGHVWVHVGVVADASAQGQVWLDDVRVEISHVGRQGFP